MANSNSTVETVQSSKLRGFIGATVRLYGYPGTFKVCAKSTNNLHAWFVRPIRGDWDGGGFSILDGSIVSVGTKRVALLSLPICPPAADYPYQRTIVVPSELDRTYPLCRKIENDPRFLVLPCESSFYE